MTLYILVQIINEEMTKEMLSLVISGVEVISEDSFTDKKINMLYKL
jgi:hypothetical protein